MSFKKFILEAEDNRNNALSAFLFDLLFYAVQVHTWHLQTGSFEVHMALNDLYNDIPGVTDGLAESLMAITGQKLTTPTKQYCLEQKVLTTEEIVASIIGVKNCATEFFNATADEAGINNTLAEVVAILDKAIYKLTQLR